MKQVKHHIHETINNETSGQTWHTQFRIGTYINDQFTFNENSQFPRGEENLDQFFLQMTPDTASDSTHGDQSININLVAKAVAEVIDKVNSKTGKKSILFSHSQGGFPGWESARYTDKIASIITIEPGSAPNVNGDDYRVLSQKEIPIAFYYSDYIGTNFTDVPSAMM